MSDQITREELQAWAEANKESASALSKLTSLVEGNAEKLDDVLEMKDNVIDNIVGKSDDGTRTTLAAIKKDTSSTREDMKRMVFVVCSISLIAAAAAVVANIVLRQIQDTKIVDTTMSKYFLKHADKISNNIQVDENK